jgi:putative tryptophan/tyrosine transport system substrate-binding protein
MRRREFIAGLGGIAVAWPLAGQAQQPPGMRRLGILWPHNENDPTTKAWHSAFMLGLAELGWIEGNNLRIDVRWNPRTNEQTQMFAKELIDLRPEVLVTGTGRLTGALQQQTKTIPIVMVGAGDPLALGLVKSLSRPEGNTTGVTDIFPSIAGKWLELLRECVPGLVRVAMIFDPDRLSGLTAYDAAIQAGAKFGVQVTKIPVRNADEIELAVTAFATEPGGGLIVLPPPLLGPERQVLNRLAVQYRLPVIYQDRSFAVEGGLLSYGADMIDMFRHGGPPYVDRILRGAKPGDLPVQFPTKFQLVVNLKTAKAMGLTIPESFLNLEADEVIE